MGKEPGTHGLDDATALKWQYVFFFVVSAGGSLAWSLMGHRWIPMIWAAVGMFAYLGLAYLRSPERVQTEDFADSFYYLGFLLTLVALVGVLLQLGDTAEEEVLRAVLSQFGLALITTVIGLVGRVVILMFQEGDTDLAESSRKRMEKAHEDLQQAMERVAVEAAAFADDFSGRLRRSLAPIEDETKAFVVAVSSSSEDVRTTGHEFSRLTDALRETSGNLGDAWERLLERIEEANEEAERALVGIRRDREISREELEKLSREIQATADDASQQMAGSVGQLVSSASQVRDEIRSFQGAVTSLPRAMADELERVTSSVGQLDGQMNRLRTRFNELQEKTTQLASVFEAGRGNIEGEIQQWTENRERLGRIQRDLISRSADASEAILRVREELGDAVLLLSEIVRGDGKGSNAP